MTCLTHYREFIAKLVISSDLLYQMYIVINASKTTEIETTQETTTPDIMWFTPSVGATSTNYVLFNLLQNHSLICALSCRSLQSSTAAHIAAGLCAHSCRSFLNLLTKPSVHTAAEVVHAHSWDLSFPYKIILSFTLIFLTS